MMSAGRSRMLMIGACCLAAVIAAIGVTASSGDSPPKYSRLTAAPPSGFSPQLQMPPAPIGLTAGWTYLPDPQNVGLIDGWGTSGAPAQTWTPISVPHVMNASVSPGSELGTDGWYKLRFTAPALSPGRSWAIHFGEVRRRADVWLNGGFLGSHTLTYAPFDLPASTLKPDAENVLVVRVDSRRGPGSLPQDWWNWGGITQPVTLVPVGRLRLQDLGVMPELGCSYHCGDLLVQGTVRNLGRTALAPQIQVTVTAPGGRTSRITHAVPVTSRGQETAVSFRVPIRERPQLWSPKSPALYNVRVVTIAGQRAEQVNSLRVGMRSVQVRRGILYLNGQRLWLHGASIHEDVPGRGAALSDADIQTIVAELKSLGANVTRAHYLLDARLLDALDAGGILVWSQPPVDHADRVLARPAGRRQALALLRATVLGGRSHPSVIINSVGNELSPTPDTTPGTSSYLQTAIPLTRQLDPASAVALDTYCYPGFPAQAPYSHVDVLGISHYFGWYPGIAGHSISSFDQLLPFLKQSHTRYPNQALVVAEFGAEGLFAGSPTVKGSYQFQTDYLKQTFGVLDRLPFMNGAIYWTLREFAVNPWWVGGATLPPGEAPDGLHHKGLIGYNGRPKPAYSVAQHLLGESPAYVR